MKKAAKRLLSGWLLLVVAVFVALPVIASFAAGSVDQTNPIGLTPDSPDSSLIWKCEELKQQPEDGALVAITSSDVSKALWPSVWKKTEAQSLLGAADVADKNNLLGAAVWHVEQFKDGNGNAFSRLYVLSGGVKFYLQMTPATQAERQEEDAEATAAAQAAADAAAVEAATAAGDENAGDAKAEPVQPVMKTVVDELDGSVLLTKDETQASALSIDVEHGRISLFNLDPKVEGSALFLDPADKWFTSHRATKVDDGLLKFWLATGEKPAADPEPEAQPDADKKDEAGNGGNAGGIEGGNQTEGDDEKNPETEGDGYEAVAVKPEQPSVKLTALGDIEKKLASGSVVAFSPQDDESTFMWPVTVETGNGVRGLAAKGDMAPKEAAVWQLEAVEADGEQTGLFRVYAKDAESGEKWYLQVTAPAEGETYGSVALVKEAEKASALGIDLTDGARRVYLPGEDGGASAFLQYDKTEGAFVAMAAEGDLGIYLPEAAPRKLMAMAAPRAAANPNVIPTVMPAGATLNLFDYWIDEQHAVDSPPVDGGGVSDDNYRNKSGINDGRTLKFRSWGSGEGAYNYKANKFTDGPNPQQGIVKRQLVGGYPVLSGDSNLMSKANENESLNYLFDENVLEANVSTLVTNWWGGTSEKITRSNVKEVHTNVGGLFTHTSDGYYEYNSRTNFAQYNYDTNTLDVMNGKAVTPTRDDTTRGQFFPFNDYNQIINKRNVTSQNEMINHYFGMHLKMNFYQENSGRDDYGKDRQFKFAGDDDVWVFIDNILVADLGGVHQETETLIDFATGEVFVYKPGLTYDQLKSNKKGDVYQKTTIREQYEKALDKSEAAKYFEGDTSVFKDGTVHEMNMFYLERGNSESNLQIRFNLVQVSSAQIKKVDEKGAPIANTEFTLVDSNHNGDQAGGASLTGTTDDHGIWVIADENGNELSITDLYNRFGKYFVVKESKVPEGYGSSLAAADGVLMRVVPQDTLSSGQLVRGRLEVVHEIGGSASDSPSYIKASTVAVGDVNTSAFIYVMNRPNKLSFKKIDEKGNVLDGAKFELKQTKDESGKPVSDAEPLKSTSAQEPGIVSFAKIPLGTYELREVVAPNDKFSVTSNVWTVEVKNDGIGIKNKDGKAAETKDVTWSPITVASGIDLRDSSKTVDPQKFEVKNYQKRQITIVKVDKDDPDKKLGGAKFELFRGDTPVKNDLSTKNDGTVVIGNDLINMPGTYKLVETQAPDGYMTPTDGNNLTFKFEVDENGVVKFDDGVVTGDKNLVVFNAETTDGDNNGYIDCTFTVKNETIKFNLPETGGVDRSKIVAIFVSVALAIIGVARIWLGKYAFRF